MIILFYLMDVEIEVRLGGERVLGCWLGVGLWVCSL